MFITKATNLIRFNGPTSSDSQFNKLRSIFTNYQPSTNNTTITTMQTSPLTKIIFLAGILATGFLLIILSGSLYNNWYPLYVVLVFLLAPLPNMLSSSNDHYDDFLGSGAGGIGNNADFAKFVTGMLVFSGVLIPIVFNHCGLIRDTAMYMSLSGGALIYLSIVLFVSFFEKREDDFGY